MGPVGLSSPLSRCVDTSPRTLGTMLHDDCQSPLSPRFTWRWRCHTWPASALGVPLPGRGRLAAARPRQGSCAPGTPRLPGISDQETTGSPKFSSDPLMTCPALGPPWCPKHSPERTQDYGLPARASRRLSPRCCCRYPCGPRLYQFRGSITRPITSLPLAPHLRYWLST